MLFWWSFVGKLRLCEVDDIFCIQYYLYVYIYIQYTNNAHNVMGDLRQSNLN